MKKRILSFVFVAVIIFGSICTPFLALAADDTTDYLLEEMETNMPDFDPAKYVANADGAPMIVGSTLYESYHQQLGTWSGTVFSLYVFNPRQLDIRSALVDLHVNIFNDKYPNGRDVLNDSLRFYRDDYSDDKLFYKLSIDIGSELTSAQYTPGDYSLWFLTNSIELSYYSGTDKKACTLNQIHESTFEPLVEGGFNVMTTSTALEELDVNITSYKIGTVNTDLTRRYEVFTAYFAIPEDYIKYYENLYSVTASYERKHTTPIFWGDDPNLTELDLMLKNTRFISSDFSSDLVKYNASTIVNLNKEGFNFDHSLTGPFYWWFYNEDGAEGTVSQSELAAHIEEYDGFSNYTLFNEWESVTMTKTIDDTFDTFSYYQNAEFKDYWSDFGADYAILLWFLENAEVFESLGGAFLLAEEVAEYLEKDYALPDEYKDHLTDAQNLYIFSEEERASALSLSNEELSRKYLIDIKDVAVFREYLTANPYTVLFRYDVAENYHDSIKRVTDVEYDALGNALALKVDSDHSFGVSSYNMYLDFEVIDVTFRVEDEYISVATKSEKKNYIPSAGGATMPETPSLDNLGEDVFDGVRDYFSNGGFSEDVNDAVNPIAEFFGGLGAEITKIIGNTVKSFLDGFGDGVFDGSWNVIKRILIVVGIGLVVLVLVWIIKSVAGSDFFNVVFTGKNISLKSKEVAIRSAESDTRRREAEDNAKLRRRELDIKATEQRNRKAEADTDAKLRERDLARREREAADNKEARRIDQEIKAQELITRSEKDDRDFTLKKSADERSERYLKMREKAEKRTASDFRRKQKEIREKDKAKKDKKVVSSTNKTIDELWDEALERTYKDDKSDKK